MELEQPYDAADMTTPFAATTSKKPSFADRLKQGNAKISVNDIGARGAKFSTSDVIQAKEIIQHFHSQFKDPDCITHLQKMPSMKGKQRWNIIFSEAKMVDTVINELVKLPSVAEQEVGVEFVPVRKRALLVTIPDAPPNISDHEIRTICPIIVPC